MTPRLRITGPMEGALISISMAAIRGQCHILYGVNEDVCFIKNILSAKLVNTDHWDLTELAPIDFWY